MAGPIQTFREERLDILSGTRGGVGSKAVLAGDLPDAVFAVISQQADAKSAVLTADVPLATAAWLDGPTIILGPGIWHVQAQIQMRTIGALGGPTLVCARIHDGSLELSSALCRIGPSTDDAASLSISVLLKSKLRRTVSIQVKPGTGEANLVMAATCAPLSDGTETATRLFAVKMMGK